MNYEILLLMLVNALHGKDAIIKTEKKNYLAQLRESKSNKKINNNAEHGLDYQNEPDWIDKCSVKSGGKTRGEMVQHDIVGCGGGIDMKCRGGCLKIHKLL